MSRFEDYDYEEQFPNQGEFWHANVQRALSGKRGKKALSEMREALFALPEKRLIAGALCTVGGVEQRARPNDPHGWYREDLAAKVESEGEGVCAIGAYLWFKKVKAGADPQAAFDELPTLLDSEGEGDLATADAGRAAGLTFTLAWTLASRNDSAFDDMTPEQRYSAFMKWLDEQLADPEPAHA
jgi:hypothetical protein